MSFARPAAAPQTHRHGRRLSRPLWSAIAAALLSVLLVPAPAARATTSVDTVGSTTSGSATWFRDRLLARTNIRRVAHGCRPLRTNAALSLAAQRHTTLMSYQYNLSHRLAGEPDMVVRAVTAGYTNWRLLAENLAWGQPTPRAMFRAWVRSPAHRANLDNCRLRDVGIAVVYRNGQPWATSDFGRRF